MTARKETELAARLAELDITPAELATIIRRPADEVAAWVAGDAEPDGEAKILLRIVTDPERAHAAALAVQRVRDGFTRDMRGDAATLAGITAVPANGAGHHGPTGGRPE